MPEKFEVKKQQLQNTFIHTSTKTNRNKLLQMLW